MRDLVHLRSSKKKPREAVNKSAGFVGKVCQGFSKLVKAVLDPPEEHVPGRRRAIRNAAILTAGIAWAGGSLLAMNDNISREESLEAIAESMSEKPRLEKLKPGDIVPEDERRATTVMIGSIPGMTIAGYKTEVFHQGLMPILSKLLPGTNVVLVTPDGLGEEALEMMKETYPKLEFSNCELPRTNDGLNYMQDVVTPTGKRNADGRLGIVMSSIEREEYGKMTKEKNDDAVGENLSNALLKKIARVEDDKNASLGTRLFADEWLVKNNFLKFKGNFVPVMVRNGDLRIARMPSGNVGVIVGRENLMRMLAVLSKDTEVEDFLELLEIIKQRYREFFGVEEVIILDEESLRKHGKGLPVKNAKKIGNYRKFFHQDMIVNPMTNRKGEYVAFCSDIDGYQNNGEQSYLRRVQNQMEELGYRVVKLPCGKYATMNYVNCTPFINDEGEKYVYLPQYGIPEDAEALRIYEENGVKVIPIDFSSLKSTDKSGSLHCIMPVLE